MNEPDVTIRAAAYAKLAERLFPRRARQAS